MPTVAVALIAVALLFAAGWVLLPYKQLTHWMNWIGVVFWSDAVLQVFASFQWAQVMPPERAAIVGLVCNLLVSVARERERIRERKRGDV